MPDPRSRPVVGETDGREGRPASLLPAEPGRAAAGFWADQSGRMLTHKDGVSVGLACLIPGEPSRGRGSSVSLIERLLAKDPLFTGIGIVKARKLRERFGDRLHAALAAADPEIADILNPELAANTCAAYRSKLAEMDLATWLDELGVGHRLAEKVVRFWGPRGAELLRSNPCLLIAFAPWATVEQLCDQLGISSTDPRRVVAAVEAVLYARLDQSHTWTSASDLKQRLGRYLSAPAIQMAGDLAVEHKGATVFDGGYQPTGAAFMEAYIARHLGDLAAPAEQLDLIAREITDHEIELALNAFDEASEYPLTDRQRDAVRMALDTRVSFLGGYAGSGKTTVLKAICDVAEEYGRVVHLMALSGRAARRISEATERRATTIASFLKQIKSRKQPLGPESIVIIDEASMVDLPMAYQLIRTIGTARLLMVGDPAQLPPIGFGSVFHTLIAQPNLPNVILDRVHRQTAESGIPAVAEAVRNGRRPRLTAFEGRRPGVSFVDCSETKARAEIERIGRKLAADDYRRGDIQIVSPIRRGDAGIDAINRYFHDRRYRDQETFPGRPGIAVGDPVIWTKNDWERDLQNGSMGRLRAVAGDDAILELDGREIVSSAWDAEMIELAYAISVHKSQGSQWPCVIVPVFPSKILDRTLLYTAITRASEQVILVGDQDAFMSAVESDAAVDQRRTTLAARLAPLDLENGGKPSSAKF